MVFNKNFEKNIFRPKNKIQAFTKIVLNAYA